MKLRLFLLIFVLFVGVVIFIVDSKLGFEGDETLVLVNIVFRHGDRTVPQSESYQNDPYTNSTYFPYGRGQLTIEGKRRMLKVGMELRQRYNEYLGDTYTNDIVYSISSQLDRTKMSLQLVLATLFPPKEPYIIDPLYHNWQPIPYNYIKLEEDDMLRFSVKCKYYETIIEDYFETPTVKLLDNKYRDVYAYLENHSGKNITNLYTAANFYGVFKSQVEYGYKLMEWTKNIYPEPLNLLYKQMWRALVGTFKGRKLSSGKLLKTISDNCLQKVNNTLPIGRKLYLYSGHDHNINGLLASLKIEHDFTLPYSSYIVFELHKIDEEYSMKVFYQDYSKVNPILKTVGDCDTFCPITKFIDVTKKYFPNPNIC